MDPLEMPTMLKRTVAVLTVLLVGLVAVATHPQDPDLDAKIKAADDEVYGLKAEIEEAEKMQVGANSGRTYLISLLISERAGYGVVAVTREEFESTVSHLVASGALNPQRAIAMTRKSVERSKHFDKAINRVVADLKRELKQAQDEYRRLIDLRAKQNESLDYPNLAGAWESDYYGSWQGTTIAQSGMKLTFTNEKGDSSPGEFLSKTSIKATKWEGGLTATIESPNRIRWSNGSTWRRKGSGSR